MTDMNKELSFKDLIEKLIQEQQVNNTLLTRMLSTLVTINMKLDELIEDNAPLYVISGEDFPTGDSDAKA